ncbi:MAG TPA: putative Se/S carrier-like protein [Spirochaetota bacterium]
MERYLMTFSTLTELNKVKRAASSLYLPMRQTPSCIAGPGCGFAVSLTCELIPEVIRIVSHVGVPYRLYWIARADKEKAEYLMLEVHHDLSE